MDNDIENEQLRCDSRQLAFLIYDFLQEESWMKKYPKNSRAKIKKAANYIKDVYKVGNLGYLTAPVVPPDEYSLEMVFVFGLNPVPVKDRIAAETHKRKGNGFMRMDMFKPAEVEYTKAIELDPRNAVSFCNRAASRVRLNFFAEAVADCKKALELDKNYVKAYCWMGFANVLMDQPGRAICCYRKALRIDPRNSVCIENMDLINKNMNHKIFRVFEPLCRLVRNAKSKVIKQSLLQMEKDGDGNKEEIKAKFETVKFAHEKLD